MIRTYRDGNKEDVKIQGETARDLEYTEGEERKEKEGKQKAELQCPFTCWCG